MIGVVEWTIHQQLTSQSCIRSRATRRSTTSRLQVEGLILIRGGK